MPTQSERIEEVFACAVELPTVERTAFIETECDGDENLKNEVVRLLGFHEKNRTSEFVLDRPLVDLEIDSDLLAEIAESEGDTIGRYKLLERIGEGGMGVVYMAEQLEGVRRRVALKIIKLGMDTRQVIARFEVERQAMAMFDHPCITRVLDAGSTSTGRPYFVMELVRGTNIAKYAENNSLSLPDRLSLFISVCNAVQHAHHKGIIHRDLKPSNILVTLFDGVPVPKVIDFGIAKSIGQQRLTDKTLFTRYSSMVGTPQYMSPEQAEMTGIDVDTRSDIYSLGVLLYELVTGSTPISGADLKELNPLALYETLRDSTVETPSSRLARTQNNQIEQGISLIPASSHQIGNELDWIIMKALSRDRSARYASANEFAADVQRFLDGDPVLAAPPSKLYQLGSYFKKYRKAAVTAAIVALALVTATVACSIFAIKARSANQKLSQVVGQLQENVQQLEVAQKDAIDARDGIIYDSAHAIALEKFGFQFQDKMDDLADELFPFLATESEAGSDDILNATLENQPNADHEASEEDNFSEVFRDSDFYGFLICTNFEVKEHSEECLLIQKEIANRLVEYRPDFFRLVVEEYRRAFGEQDPRVTDGLQLLAASLIDIKKYDEASAHLREAAILGDQSQKKISWTLLDQVEHKKQQTLIKPKQTSPSN